MPRSLHPGTLAVPSLLGRSQAEHGFIAFGGDSLMNAMPFQTFEVLGVRLFVQDKDNACWFASAMMLLNWKERFRPGLANSCSAVDRKTIALYKADHGIQNSQTIPLAKRLGLVAIPPMSPTVEAMRDWLQKYGPLWMNGKGHIVVIAGIRQTSFGAYELKVYDPAPGWGVGWRSLAGWYTGIGPGADVDSRDTSDAVRAIFLRAP
jgi:hypothetical protein